MKIEKKQIRWYGHIIRIESDRLVKVIYETGQRKKRNEGITTASNKPLIT